MNQKLTVLSLASLLLLAPVHSSFAQTSDTSSTSSSDSGSNDTSSTSSSDSGSNDTSSTSSSDSGSNDTSSDSSSNSGSNDTSSDSSSDSGSNDTSSDSSSDSGSNDTSSDSSSDSGSNDTSSNSDDEADSFNTEDDQTHPSGTNSDTENGAAPTTPNGSASFESLLEDMEDELGFDLTDKSFDSNFDEVMNLSWSVGEFRSMVDPAAYEQYLEEQKAAMDLFTVKENMDYNSTINEFQQSLSANPDNNNLYVELALAYLANGDLNNAEEIAKQLDAKAPESYLSLILQAELAGSQGKTDEKQLYLEQAVEKNPTSAVARFKLGEELTKAGKPNEAIAQLSTSAALNPENPLVFEELNNAFAQTNNTELKTFVNGVVPKFEVQPFIENGFTLVSARAIAESLGANVEWNDATQQVTIQRDEMTIQLTNESNVAFVNGQEVTIDAPAQIVNGSTVLPLRFVAESLGAKVDWKAESQMIVISE